MRKLFLFGLFLTILHDINSQVLFSKTLGDSLKDYGYAISPCYDSGYITVSKLYGGTKIIKLDKQADTVWTKATDLTTILSVIQLRDSNYVFSGTDLTDSSLKVVKIDSVGSIIWKTSIFGFKSANYLGGNVSSVVEDHQGNIVIAASKSRLGQGCCDPIFKRLNRNGVIDNSFSPTIACRSIIFDGCRPSALIVDNTGDYVVAMIDPSSAAPNPKLVKIDTSGKVVWDVYYNSTAAVITDLIQDVDSGYLLVGSNSNRSIDSTQLFKFDFNGNFVFWKKYRDSLNFWHSQFINRFDNGYLISGNSDWIDYQFNIMKLDSNYIPEWSNSYGKIGSVEGIYDMEVTLDENVILFGTTDSLGNGNSDLYLIKLNVKGLVVGEEEIGKGEMRKWKVETYPNPTSENLHLRIEQQNVIRKIQLFDLLGKEQAVVTDQKDHWNYTLNLNGLPKGIYILSLQAKDGSTVSKKVVKN